MKLLASLTSPFVRKVRIVMAEKKLDFDMQIENVWAPDCKVQEINPLGKVPCLVTEDGGALFDSRVIVEYLDTLSPVSRLIPSGGRDRAAVKCWEALADGTLDACVIIVKELQRPQPQQSQEWIARQYGKIDAALKSEIEAAIAEAKTAIEGGDVAEMNAKTQALTDKAMKMGPMATNTPTAMVEIARKPAVDMNNMAAAFQRPSAAAAAPPLKT